MFLSVGLGLQRNCTFIILSCNYFCDKFCHENFQHSFYPHGYFIRDYSTDFDK